MNNLPELEEFEKLDFQAQKQIYDTHIKGGNMWTMPLWTERLNTAIENKKPMALYGISNLNKFYLLYINCK